MKYAPLLALCLMACGDDTSGGTDDGGGGGGDDPVVDRGGPESLSGFRWTSEPMNVNGTTLQLSFEFGASMVTLLGSCDGGAPVSVAAPVRYTYAATVQSGAADRAERGDETCEVGIAPGSFEFEVQDNQIMVGQGDERITFDATGIRSGLYGTWRADANFGTLFWSIGNGRIAARTECTNGLIARTTAPTTFRNFVTLEAATAGDDSCMIGIAAGTFEYRFEGETLVMDIQGGEVRFDTD
jgi:hypothetical protein